MNVLSKYYKWASRSPGLVSFGFLFSMFGLIVFINSQYGLQRVDPRSGEKGISVFGEEIINLLLLHVLVSTVWSIIRIVRRTIKGTYEFEYGSKTFHEVSVLIMPFTIILIILYALVFI